MDFRFLYNRTKYFIISPVKAWEGVHSENRPIKDIRGSFFLPLVILASISSFFGSMFFINTTLKPMYSVLAGLDTFLFLYLGVYASAFIVKEITRALDLGHDFIVAFKLVAYSLTPIFLTLTISRLMESLLFINLLGLYGLYIFWTGMQEMVNPPEHKKLPMLIATVVSMVIIFGSLQLLLSRLTQMIYFALFA
jgi:Yip1 domain